MKLRSFISRLKELNAYLKDLPPDTEGQKTKPLRAGENFYGYFLSLHAHHVKKNMIEQVYNYAYSTVKEMTDLFETRVANLELKEDQKKFCAFSKKEKDTKATKIRKWMILTQG